MITYSAGAWWVNITIKARAWEPQAGAIDRRVHEDSRESAGQGKGVQKDTQKLDGRKRCVRFTSTDWKGWG